MPDSTPYPPETGVEICAALADGITLSEYCRRPGTPHRSLIYHWRKVRPDFAAAMDEARKLGYDVLAERALEIANTPHELETVSTGPLGTTVTRADSVAHRKLQVWTTLELLKKWDPKRYADRQAVEVSGPDGAPLASVNLTTTDPVEASRVYQQLIGGK